VTPDGASGWDDYARYYDWENARTIGTRDVVFWRSLVASSPGPAIELGCGTGRVLLKTSGVVSVRSARKRHPRSFPVIGVDLSQPMLDIARRRAKRLKPAARPALIRADIRALPIATASAALVMAPYGILQSLVRDADLGRALAETARVLRSGGQFVVDLVPDLQKWTPYRGRVRMRGKGQAGKTLTLVESVRQDRRRGLTVFDEEFIEQPAGRANGRMARSTTRRFSLTFRTLPMAETTRRLVRAGFEIDAKHGGYRGESWTPRSETWLILARKR
jgi:ubiquinone/menaquinone biosynthesis C-methylase UbiE